MSRVEDGYAEEAAQADALVAEGHLEVCAARQVWGRGGCTCDRPPSPPVVTAEDVAWVEEVIADGHRRDPC